MCCAAGMAACLAVASHLLACHPCSTEQSLVCHPHHHAVQVPPKIYFKGGCLEVALRELKGKQRAFIVTGAHRCLPAKLSQLARQPTDSGVWGRAATYASAS